MVHFDSALTSGTLTKLRRRILIHSPDLMIASLVLVLPGSSPPWIVTQGSGKSHSQKIIRRKLLSQVIVVHGSTRECPLGYAMLLWHSCLVYIDDVIIFSSTFEQHVKHIEEVLVALKEGGLEL